MRRKEMAVQFVNELARAILITEGFCDPQFSKIQFQRGFPEHSHETRTKLNSLWKESFESFIAKLHQYIDELDHMEDPSKFSHAYEICVWMDEHITYKNKRKEKISLSSICPIDDTTPTVIMSLNSNATSVGIWINPKFPVSKCKIRRQGKLEDYVVASTNVFYRMNNHLQNCSYFPCKNEGYTSVRNVIISNGAISKRNTLSVAFAPLSDSHSLIERKSVIYTTESGYECCGMVCSIKETRRLSLLERTKKDWIMAGENNVDILFMPEMLGTVESCGLNKDIIEWMNDLFIYEVKGKNAPMMTVLPSHWCERENSATIVSHDGSVLGIQKKHVPYVSSKDHAIEALKKYERKEFIVIHIPEVQRVAVVICSEFLEDDNVHWSKLLCSCLGVSLVIVPSYSPGEKSFINLLASWNRFGTSIIWGNCCGAIREDNDSGIGGFMMAGELGSHVFSNVCKCNNACENKDRCAFVVGIPRKIEYSKGTISYGTKIKQIGP